jgi:transcriptional regulator GlxA family with amidase domain
MQAQATAPTENYSLDTMIRYAFHYEVQNNLQTRPNQNDPELQTVIRYMEARIAEIAKKYK